MTPCEKRAVHLSQRRTEPPPNPFMRFSITRWNTFCAKSQIFWQLCTARALDWITCVLRRLHGQVQVGLASKTEGRILQCLPRGALPVFDLPPAKLDTEAEPWLQSTFQKNVQDVDKLKDALFWIIPACK